MKEAKDKSEELIEKFGIEKALLCVDEILKILDKLHNRSVLSEYVDLKELQEYVFYQQVKQEILNRQ